MTVIDPFAYHPNRSLPAKLKRRLTQWRPAKPLAADPDRAIVTFTFDDFPKTAAQFGADALDRFGMKATYFAATGLRASVQPCGRLFDYDDLEGLIAAGHEIGLHTRTHLDCALTDTETVRCELLANRNDLTTMLARQPARHLAWPYGETHHGAKMIASGLVDTARGILPGINREGADLMQLRAYELTRNEGTIERAAKAIEDAANTPGWVILFTHDVQPDPSPFGTTPAALKRLAQLARDSGAVVETMTSALSQINARVAA